MPLTFSRENPALLKAVALTATRSEDFADDAQFLLASSGKDPLAVAVYQRIAPDGGAEFHFGGLSPRWARRDLIYGLSLFAQRQLRLTYLYAPIAQANTVAQVAALKCGFVVHSIVPGGALDGSDAILLFKTLDSGQPPRSSPEHDDTEA